METFLTAVLSFPTIIFTIAMAFVLLYASLIMFGPLRLDSILSIGAAGGMLHAADLRIVKGGILTRLGIRGVPLMIIAVLLALFGWSYSFLMMYFGQTWIGEGMAGFLVKSIIGVVAFGLGAVTAFALVRPFRSVFVIARATSRTSLVGRTCTVQSGSVNGDTGRAEIADGGAGVLAEVRCTQENDLGRGSTALVYDYDQQRGVYMVAPVNEPRDVANHIIEMN